jgi:large subunit ribosomal protein L9
VFNLGHAGDVRNVADGYGRNYLLPRGLAVLATPAALKRAERLKVVATDKRAREKSDVDALAQMIGGSQFSFTVRAGEKGKLYGSITAAQIADQISRKLGTEFDKRKVALREPIREVGTYQVPVRLAADVAPTITVTVQPEGVAIAAAAAATATVAEPLEAELAPADAAPEPDAAAS